MATHRADPLEELLPSRNRAVRNELRAVLHPAAHLGEREDPGPKLGPDHPDSLRERRGLLPLGKGVPTVTLPAMRQGRVGIMLSTIMSRVQEPMTTMNDGVRTQLAAHAMGQSHLHSY